MTCGGVNVILLFTVIDVFPPTNKVKKRKNIIAPVLRVERNVAKMSVVMEKVPLFVH